LAQTRCDPYLFNHSVRCWPFSAQLAAGTGQAFDEEVLAVGCLLRDIGLAKGFEERSASKSRAATPPAASYANWTLTTGALS
jgi:HD superfamily phosphodiesterase